MFKKIFKSIFVSSRVLASVWKVFIKFHWHGQNATCVALERLYSVRDYKSQVVQKINLL